MHPAAPCFTRRETRLTFRDMINGLLAELETRNCRALAEAAGHANPYRMQHLLSRARFDKQQALGTGADWAVARLSAGSDGKDTVLIIDRGTRAGFVADDEVYGGLALRKTIRELGPSYVLAVRSSYRVTLTSGRGLTAQKAADLLNPGMWQRMRTGHGLKGAKEAKDYDWAMNPVPLAKLIAVATMRWKKITSSPSRSAVWTRARSPPGPPGTAGQRSACSPTCSSSPPPSSATSTAAMAHPDSSPSPSPNCSACSAAPSSPNPAATGPTGMAGRYGAAATSTAPGKPTGAHWARLRRCAARITIYNCRSSEVGDRLLVGAVGLAERTAGRSGLGDLGGAGMMTTRTSAVVVR